MSKKYPDLPKRMASLPVDHRGFPVPWFVAWCDGEPIFPAMDPLKLKRAWRSRRCWVCGEPLGRFSTFVVGPMCAVNRVSSEPPSHLECAHFSVRYCPFLTRPRMGRVPIDKYGGTTETVAGIMIDRNPGVSLVWTTKNPRLDIVKNGWLFDIGDPYDIEWWAEGREATRDEILASINSGLPLLEATIEQEKPSERAAAKAELDRRVAQAMELVP